jgi:hypothetical protein
VSVSDNSFGNIQVYPNPASSNIWVNVNKVSSTGVSVEISTMDGKLLYKSDRLENGKTNIELSNFASGMYFLKVINGNQSHVSKLVIE